MEEKGEKYFGIVIAYSKKEKVKVKTVGKTLNLLSILVSLSKCLAERIAEENGVRLENAENIVADCIRDGMKTIEK